MSTTHVDHRRVESTDLNRLTARVRELEEQLRRERARNAGLERGLSALSDQVTAQRRRRGHLT